MINMWLINKVAGDLGLTTVQVIDNDNIMDTLEDYEKGKIESYEQVLTILHGKGSAIV